jgi:hypothetical protein
MTQELVRRYNAKYAKTGAPAKKAEPKKAAPAAAPATK